MKKHISKILLCLVVVLAGSILGVVLVNKNKGKGNSNGPGNSNGGPIVKYELTEGQKKMVEAINKSANTSAEIAPQYDYSKFVINDGGVYSSVDFDNINAIYDNYFAYKITDGYTLMIRDLEDTERVSFIDLFDILNIPQNTLFKSVISNHNNLVYCAYGYQGEGEFVAKRLVVDLSDLSNVSVIKEIEMTNTSVDDLKLDLVINSTIYLKDSYFINLESSLAGSNYKDLQVFDLTGNEVFELSNVSQFEIREFNDNNYYFVVDSKVYFGSLVNNSFKTFDLTEDADCLYNYTISNDYLFVEKISIASGNDLGVDGKSYEYSIFNFKSNELKTLSLESGYVKATFDSSSTGGYYYIFMQKANEDKTDFEEKGLMVYFDSNNEPIVKYESNSIENKIIYSSGNKILTKYAIYSTQNTLNADMLKLFGEKAYVETQMINNSTYIVYDSSLYYIYDLNGNKLYEKGMATIYSYNNGVYFALDTKKNIYTVNVVTDSNYKLISTFVYDNNNYNISSVMNGAGVYFTQNSNNSLKSIHTFDGEVLYPNVKSFEFVNKNTSFLVATLDDDSNVTIDLKVTISNSNNESDEGIDPVQTYYSKDGTSWSSGGSTGDEYDTYSRAYIAAYDGKYVKSVKFVFYGSAVIGQWFANSTITVSYEYITGAISTTSVENVTGNKLDDPDSIGSNYHQLIVHPYFHYVFFGEWDDHIGEFLGCENVSLENLYVDVTAYAMTTASDYDDRKNAPDLDENPPNYYDNTAETKTIIKGGTFNIPSDPGCIGGTLEGYTALFDSTQNEPYSKDTVYTDTSGPITVEDSYFYKSPTPKSYHTYAKYSENTYQIAEYVYWDEIDSSTKTEFDNANHALNTDILYTDEITVKNPVRAGFRFTGWTVIYDDTEVAITQPDSKTGLPQSSNEKYKKLAGEQGAKLRFIANWEGLNYKIEFVLGHITGQNNAEILVEELFTNSAIGKITNGKSSIYTTDYLKGEYETSFTKKKSETEEAIGEISITNYYKTSTAKPDTTIFSFKFAKDGIHDNLGTHMYNFTQSDTCKSNSIKPMNDAENNKTNPNFGFNVLNSQYYISNWAYETGLGSNEFVIISGTGKSIIDYLLDHDKEVYGEDGEENYIIKLYAVYRPKIYNISYGREDNYGKGSINDQISTNNVQQTINYEYKDISISSTYKVGQDPVAFESTHTINSTSNPIINIKINNDNKENGFYYIIDKIEITKLGYAYLDGSTTKYEYASITFINPKSKSNTNTGETQFYNLATVTLEHDSSTHTLGAQGNKIGEYYYVAPNQNGINGFKVSPFNNDQFQIEFKNVGYAGSNANTINASSVNGNGDFGFNVKVYYQSLYTPNDVVEKNADSNSSLVSDYGEILQTNVTPLYFQPAINNTTGGNTNLYYFWLNGKKVVICDNTTPTAPTDSGDYYTVTSTSLNSAVNYTVSNVLFVANRATKNDTSAGFGSNPNVVYVERIITNGNSYGKVYYLGGATTSSELSTKNYTNYNSTQFIAITPRQELHNLSNNPADNATLSSRYELMTYLSAIGLVGQTGANSVTKVFSLEKQIYNKYVLEETSHYYEKYLIESAQCENKSTDMTIKYLGDNFSIKYIFVFTEGTREFFLYFGVREVDNFIRYFLISNVGSDNTGVSTAFTSINFVFNEVISQVKTTVSDAENIEDTVEVVYYEDKVDSANNKNIGINADKEYIDRIRPNDLYIVEIKPKDGFIVNKISVEICDRPDHLTLMSFSLSNISLNVNNVKGTDEFHTYTDSTGAVPIYLIQYTASHNKSFVSHTNGGVYGIYYSETLGTTWDASRVSHSTYAGFESIYIMVAGIYDNVSIEVETISFIEFNFKDSNNVLEKNESTEVKYFRDAVFETDGFNGYISDASASQLLNVVHVGPQTTFYSSASSTVADADGKYVLYQPDPNGKYIKYDTQNYILYKQIISGGTVKYQESQDGEYIIVEKVNKSTYTKYSGNVYGGSSTSLFLKDIKNLSIIVEPKNYSHDGTSNKVKLGVSFGDYDASLVSVLGDYIRVIFIGKFYLFENGVQIFASGEDYSAYFTNGLFYCDWGTNAGIIGPQNSSVAFEHLSDAEGRKTHVAEGVDADNTSLNKNEVITIHAGSSDKYDKKVGFESSDQLIYMQIDDITKFFESSMSWSDYRNHLNEINDADDKLEYVNSYPNDLGFENARKYYFSVDVGANSVSMNVNSFIYNANLTNTLDANNDPIDTKTDYGTINKKNPSNNISNKMASILSANNVSFRSDNRNNLVTGWSKTVTNSVKNSNVSPYMWIDTSLYQLDYVTASKVGYTTTYTPYEKSYSWFNNTVLTNIDYNYIDGSNDINKRGNLVNTNWQEICKLEYQYIDANSRIDSNHLISGYKIDYTYNAVPGYYLDYIVIETVDYGIFYISTADLGSDSSKEGDILCFQYDQSENHKTKMYYHISFDAVSNSYNFRLYDNTDDMIDIAGLNSLAILSNNITVSFFSKSHQIEINYNLNNESDNISSKNLAKTVDNNGNDYSKQSGIYYDSMSTLNALAIMKGYTFIGWASPTYNNGGTTASRYDQSTNTWNTYSSWIGVTGATNNIKEGGVSKKLNYFDYKNRDKLLSLTNYGYDFYVKSSDSDRVLKTGYFITDTGNAYVETSLRNENYNFWSVYARDFISKLGSRTEFTFVFDMYAIWKANVYAVEVEMNDKNNSNGSSNAYIALQGQRFGYSDYIWNSSVVTLVNDYKFTYAIGELSGGFANRIGSTVERQDEDDVSLSDNYYCYIKFDSDDWYLTSATNTKEILMSEMYSYYHNESATPFIYGVGNQNNQLNYVIDRYGYSWLGWFSDELADTYEDNFTAESSRCVFGSDYYYYKTSTNLTTRLMPYLRADGWVKADETMVHISDFETVVDYQDNFSTEVYSEFVYKNSYAFLDEGKTYVYHYDYKSSTAFVEIDAFTADARIAYINKDFLNEIFINNYEYGLVKKEGRETVESAIVYFDTSLTLDCFKKLESGDLQKTEDGFVVIGRKPDDESNDANYRFITLYSYWLNNKYEVVIDYRDEGSTSIDNLGSTEVTNKSEIYNATYTDSSDKSGHANKSIKETYFDDEYFDYILNMSIPTRIGYDFIGWSFFYRDPNLYLTGEEIQLGGDLYKYNGLTYASNTSYALTTSSILKTYYYNYTSTKTCANCVGNIDPSCHICGGDGIVDVNTVKTKDIYTLYNSASLNAIGELTYNNENFSSQYAVLNGDLEVYGDAERDDHHKIYIFALWRAQTFTINVGLNVDTEDLTNSYDLDSSYSVGFYKDYVDNNPTAYTGINSLFLKQKEINLQSVDTDISMYSDVYTEVVSNISFVITFDELFSESAIFTDFNSGNQIYKLKDLFAVSTGYYFVGWLYNSNDRASKLIANSLKTVYGYTSEIINNNSESGSNVIESDHFDLEWYNKLYVSNYKNMTNVDASASGSVFETSNLSKLNLVNDSGASTNFGFVKIKDDAHDDTATNYYIETEHILNPINYKTESHNLMFRYNGRKYYVQFYTNNGNIVLIQNDFSHLYYQPNPLSPLKYVIQFDYEGRPYYVLNDVTYSSMTYINGLNIAVFDNSSYLNNSNNIGRIEYDYLAKSNTFIIDDFSFETTRQFTIYADWQLKEDFTAKFTNGNNGIYDADNNIIKSDVSNPGLAGYYSVYNNSISAVEPATATQTTYHAGANNVMSGEDKDTLTYTYDFYNDLGFDLLPYFNGRFLNRMYLDFDRIEYNTSSVVTTMYQLVKYRLIFEFEWSNTDKIMKISGIKLNKYNPAGGDDKFSYNVETCVLNTSVDAYGNAVITFKNSTEATRIYKYLSVIDSISLNNSGGEGFFNISSYGSPQTRNSPNDPGNSANNKYYGRRDVNMVSFNLNDLLSSIHVTCEYSVQTYSLTVHHVFDENGDTLTQNTSNKNIYYTKFNQITAGEHYDSENSLRSNSVYTDVTPSGTNQALATIRTDLLKTGLYNVPYGYFIYGLNYDSALVGYRPMDDYYGVGNTQDYAGTTAHTFDGFNYLYQEGNYYKGRGGSGDLVLDGDGGDLYYDQGSPILGSSVVFPTKSIRFNKSFYLFKGWYEDKGVKTGGFITFDAYDEIDEATYMSRNIVLYGYYYSSNDPMNIQFYTWNNDWNENSPAYLPYLNNSDDYTLSSIEENSPYIVSGGYLKPNYGIADKFIDENGRVMLKLKKEYGVDSSQFSIDNYTGFEIGRTDPLLLNNVLKTYWYFAETYNVLYKKFDGDSENTYIKFDPEIQSEYQFVPVTDQGSIVGIIVNTLQYEDYVNDGVTIFRTLAEIESDGAGGFIAYLCNSSNVRTGETDVLKFNSDYNEYYYYDSNLEKYCYFAMTNKNTVMMKMIPEKDIFYYERGGDVYKIKVMASTDMTSATYLIWDDVSESYITPVGTSESLSIEPVFVYGDRFAGAELYAVFNLSDRDNARYYKYHKVTDEMYNSLKDGSSFIRNFSPRYYVDINGVRYYTMIHLDNNTTDYKFKELYTVNGTIYNGPSYQVTTLNNYYVLLDNVYHLINYMKIADEGGSHYINPFVYENTVELTYKKETKTYYFDYEGNSRTSGLYEIIDPEDGFVDRVLFPYNIYTPINTNYSLNAVLKNNKWESSDITLNKFPSLNIDYWIDNPEYVLLGYLNVTDFDIDTMKSSDGEAVGSNSDWQYIPELSQIVHKVQYETSGGAEGSYEILADVYIADERIVLSSSGKSLSLYYNEEENHYYFYYEDESGNSAYYYFVSDLKNTVMIKPQQGGQVFEAYENYINDLFMDTPELGDLSALRGALKDLVSGKINEFSLADLLRAPMFVDSYQLSTIDHKTIERVIMRISTQFVFEHEDIYGTVLENYVDPKYGLAEEIDDGKYRITLSTSFTYSFSLISTKTQINSNIYAIPVYAPDIIKFENDAVSVSGKNVMIDYNEMNISHFDLKTYRLYSGSYVWDLPELLPSASPEEIAEREKLLSLADYMQFVILSSEQFTALDNTKIGRDVKLNSMITGDDLDTFNDIPLISQSLLSKDNSILTFDFSDALKWQPGKDYYIAAFYYSIDAANNEIQYVFDAGENLVYTIDELRKEVLANIEDDDQKALINAMTDKQLVQYTQTLANFGNLKEIRYNKYINRISDNLVKVSIADDGSISKSIVKLSKAQA